MHDRWTFWLIVYLRLVGTAALLAFAAALMPRGWIIETSEELGFVPFPDSPLTFYLARNLSLLYGYVGALLWIVSNDVPRYRPLVGWIVWGTLSFGVLQAIVDTMAGLPMWWIVGESGSTVMGGLIFGWLNGRAGETRPSLSDDRSID